MVVDCTEEIALERITIEEASRLRYGDRVVATISNEKGNVTAGESYMVLGVSFPDTHHVVIWHFNDAVRLLQKNGIPSSFTHYENLGRYEHH